MPPFDKNNSDILLVILMKPPGSLCFPRRTGCNSSDDSSLLSVPDPLESELSLDDLDPESEPELDEEERFALLLPFFDGVVVC
jgi:hypothetical protein